MSILKTFRTNIKSETNAIENYVNKIEKIFAKIFRNHCIFLENLIYYILCKNIRRDVEYK